MSKKKSNHQGEGGGVPSRKELYAKVAANSGVCVDYLVDIVKGEVKADAVRMGAARILLNKVLPDIKVTEIQGDEDKPLGVIILPTLNDDNELETTPRPTNGGSKEN